MSSENETKTAARAGWLGLSRKVGEEVVIALPDGREVRVSVTRTGQSEVRLAVLAPAEVRVFRAELEGTEPKGRRRVAPW